MNTYTFIKSQNDRLTNTSYSVALDDDCYILVSSMDGEACIEDASYSYKVIHNTISEILKSN